MNKFLENLKRQAQEQPMIALGVAAAILAGASKLMNSAAWSREVARRSKKDRRR